MNVKCIIKGAFEVVLEGLGVISVSIYCMYGFMVFVFFLKLYIPHILLLLLGTKLLAVGCL